MTGIRTAVLMMALVALSGCASFEPLPLSNWPDSDLVLTQTQRDVTVSAGILTDDQAAQLYGVNLSDVGLQAIWLEIDNASDKDYWLMVAALDPDHFPPDEAAALFKFRLSDQDDERLVARVRELAMPLRTEAGKKSSGYVLAPAHEGGRYLAVPLFTSRELLQFGFPLRLPDGEFDFEELDAASIYAGQPQPSLDLEQLRAALRELACCTTDRDGERYGDPLNLVIVGDRESLLAALSHAGWSFTKRITPDTIRRLIGSAISGSEFAVAPVSPLYVFGRKQDLALQRARSTIVQRNHLRLWLAPFRYEEQPVWVGQVSRDVAIKLTARSPTLTTHVIDPNVDEAREDLLQSMILSDSVARFGFVDAVPPSTPDSPASNLTDDPYFTDGERMVILLSGYASVAPSQVEYLRWGTSDDPMDLAPTDESAALDAETAEQ